MESFSKTSPQYLQLMSMLNIFSRRPLCKSKILLEGNWPRSRYGTYQSDFSNCLQFETFCCKADCSFTHYIYLKTTKSVDNINKQKIANNEQDHKLVIKCQIQKDIKKPKCKSRCRTIYKLYSAKRFTIQPMENKYFRSRVEIELLEGIRECFVMLLTLQSLGLYMKQGDHDIMGKQMINFRLINQSHKKKITFAKRQAVDALIILNEKKTNFLNGNGQCTSRTDQKRKNGKFNLTLFTFACYYLERFRIVELRNRVTNPSYAKRRHTSSY